MKGERKYAVGSDMVLVKTSSPLLEGWEPCEDIRELKAATDKPVKADVRPGVKWRGNRIPADQLKKVLGTAAEFPGTETGYVLYYNPMSKAWEIRCTTQSGSGGLCKFHDDKPATPGFVEIGTIHTHPGMGAWWSATDRRDQEGKYGVHCVLGLDDGIANRYKWTIFTPHGEYDQTWEDIAEPVKLGERYEADASWVETVKEAYRPKDEPSAEKKTLAAFKLPATCGLKALLSDKRRTSEERDRLCDNDLRLDLSDREYREYVQEHWNDLYREARDERELRRHRREAGEEVMGDCLGLIISEAMARGYDLDKVLRHSGVLDDFNCRIVELESDESMKDLKEAMEGEFDDRFVLLDREDDDFEERVAILLEDVVDNAERNGGPGLDHAVTPELEDALARIGFYRKEVAECSASTSSAAEESAGS